MNREERLAKKRAYNKIYYSNNQQELVEKKRKYREENRELVNEFQRQYVERNKDKVKQRKKEYYIRNRDKIIAKRQAISEQTKQTMELYRIKNVDKIREYNRKRYKSSPQVRISKTIRSRIQDALKREHKSSRTEKLLGISFKEFKTYIEIMFKPNMSWDNYGEWEIDHIKPISSFDLTNPKEQFKAFNYKNTQPLWLSENRRKSAKILN